MRHSFSIKPLLALLFLYQGALACQCVDPYRTPYEEFDDSTAVFVGVISGYRDRVIDTSNQIVERIFHFRVEETLKGDRLKKRDVSAGLSNEMCYVAFGLVGSRHLVYAREDNGTLVSRLFCERAGLSALYFLRMKIRNVKEPRVYGVIDRQKLGKSRLRVQVFSEATKKKVFAEVDEAGRFAVDDVTDGVYLVSLETPNGDPTSTNQEYRILLGDPNRYNDFMIPKKSVFLSFPI